MLPCYLTVNYTTLYNIFLKEFPWTPTEDQEKCLRGLAQLFIPEKNQLKKDDVFLLLGYAGTGKTTVVQAFSKALKYIGWSSVLGAPTGRAAKILQGTWGQRAWTLHRMLYISVRGSDGVFKRIRRKNKGSRLIFIIDEASMISDSRENGQILNDLLNFVRSGKDCKLILVGDEAQLPPVGQIDSPALSPEILLNSYSIKAHVSLLSSVMRQSGDSGILSTATDLRNALFSKSSFFPVLRSSKEVRFINDLQELHESLESSFSHTDNDSVLITRSNARAVLYNEQIRSTLLGYEDIINAGDLVMVVQNNENWLDQKDGAGFIANGDMLEVLSWRNEEKKYGLRFADATLAWADMDAPSFEAKIILDTLSSKTSRLSKDQSSSLYSQIMDEFKKSGLDKLARSSFFRNHPYGQALQLKFGYSLTAHKAQGGQWNEVFVEKPYTDNPSGKEYIRWMYTSFTRAKKRLYLIGFSEGHDER